LLVSFQLERLHTFLHHHNRLQTSIHRNRLPTSRHHKHLPDFFIRSNIIGYTGTLGNRPTVYFMTTLGVDYIKHGRITQHYPKLKRNEGRERTRVWDKSRYSMKNECYRDDVSIKDWDYYLVEYVDGIYWHGSRNEIIPVRQDEWKVMDELAKAIDRYPSLKPLHGGFAFAHCVDSFLCDD
ncbi:hypothetical protein ACHAWF_002618, partial [Thalassiosira exigua]